MRTTIIVGSLMLAAVPAWAQQTAAMKRTLPAAASHVTLPPKPVAPATTGKAPQTKTGAAKPAATPTTPTPVAAKPTAAKASDSAESAAERILRRLDEAFPKKAPGETAAAPKRPVVKPPAATTPPARRMAETPAPQRASNHVTLNWRIALHWPGEIAPVHQVK